MTAACLPYIRLMPKSPSYLIKITKYKIHTELRFKIKTVEEIYIKIHKMVQN